MKISHEHPNFSMEERRQHLLGVHRRCVAVIRSNNRYIPNEDGQPKAFARGR